MEVKIISRELIKPSSPTINHSKTHKMSFLDQIMPHRYIPILLFYSTDHASTRDIILRRSQALQQSLSETLNLYYPLAGRFKDDLSIDCNDEGACYVVATGLNLRLCEYLNQPDLSTNATLLPKLVSNEVKSGDHVILIQETTFPCGGISIGIYVSHTIFDGTSLSVFLKTWAAIARNSSADNPLLLPNFNASLIFPGIDSFPKEKMLMSILSPFLRRGRTVTTRFVLDASAIARLKAMATSSSVRNPTRIEAVTALLQKCAMKALNLKSGIQKQTLMAHAVNLRRKALPSLSESLVGNFIWTAAATVTGEDMELSSLAGKMRESISIMDHNFVKNLQDGQEELLKFGGFVKEMCGSADPNGLDSVVFSSWCNFGLYQIDFGWGMPSWVTVVSSSSSESQSFFFMNIILIMDTRSNDGVEAYVVMEEEEMAALRNDAELLAFVSIDPSPLSL